MLSAGVGEKESKRIVNNAEKSLFAEFMASKENQKSFVRQNAMAIIEIEKSPLCAISAINSLPVVALLCEHPVVAYISVRENVKNSLRASKGIANRYNLLIMALPRHHTGRLCLKN